MGFRFRRSARLGPLRFNFAKGGLSSTGEQLWALGFVSRLLADGSLSARTVGLLSLIETPEAAEAAVRLVAEKRLLS